MKFISILCLVATLAGDGQPWLADMTEARQMAARDHKHILLNFSGSDWCGPCIKMKKEVFESEAFDKVAQEKLVLVRADFPRAKKNQLPAGQMKINEALAEKYNPNGKFPLTLLLDAQGNVLKEWDGYVIESQNKFIADLNKALAH